MTQLPIVSPTSAPDHAARAHSEHGASSAHRWMACPGSLRLSREVPERAPNPYMLEGTFAHELAERCLNNHVRPDVYRGVVLHGTTVTDELADAVGVYVDECERYRAADPHGGFVEHRFQLPFVGPETLFGTCDFVAYDPDTHTLTVVDLKYGQGVIVEPAGNSQLLYYGLGAMLSPELRGKRVDSVRLVVVQPRAFHPSGPVRQWTAPFERMARFASELRAAVIATRDPDAPLIVGEHCRFCPAAGICPAQRDHAQSLAQVEFAGAGPIQPRAPSTMSDEELQRVVELLPLLESWATAVRGHAQARLERGRPIAGLKLVARRVTRKWEDSDAALKWLFENGHVSREVLDYSIKSVAQIEKLVGKGNIPAELIHLKENGFALVPESDPRPAVALDAGDAFQGAAALGPAWQQVPPMALTAGPDIIEESENE